MFIREIEPKDAESFDLLMKEVETEAYFMLMEPGERKSLLNNNVNGWNE